MTSPPGVEICDGCVGLERLRHADTLTSMIIGAGSDVGAILDNPGTGVVVAEAKEGNLDASNALSELTAAGATLTAMLVSAYQIRTVLDDPSYCEKAKSQQSGCPKMTAIQPHLIGIQLA